MGSRSRSSDWDQWDSFMEEAAKEATRYVTKARASQYLDVLLKRGYLVGKGENFKGTKRLVGLMMQASKELRKREYPLGPDEDPREPFGWEMARIILHLDPARPLEDAVNPKELGGLAAIITAALQTFSVSPDLLREAYEAEE